MKIERYDLNIWGSKYPMFWCRVFEDYREIIKWMRENDVEYFLWSSGSGGYIFDVRGDRAAWFALRWL